MNYYSAPQQEGLQEDAESTIPLGRYELPHRSEEAHIYRLAHPLAQSMIAQAQRQTLQPSKLVLDYDAYVYATGRFRVCSQRV